ncbi:MAG: MipA/OmpV family protein, partial [Aquabacterium sp.]|nr:MipA/OmpV family protein [Aquabacterium sp.]
MTMPPHPRLASRRACASVARGLATAAMALGTAAHAAPLWELGIGAGMLRLPHYRGSDQSHLWLLPVPYVAYRGT